MGSTLVAVEIRVTAFFLLAGTMNAELRLFSLQQRQQQQVAAALFLQHEPRKATWCCRNDVEAV